MVGCLSSLARLLFWLACGACIYRYYFASLRRSVWLAVSKVLPRVHPDPDRLWHGWPEPCTSQRSLAAERNETGIKVILPSIGQTGTTSVAQAMRDLGLRTYHIEEKCLFGQVLNQDAVRPKVWARRASRCRLDVVSLEPHTDSLYTALLVSPEAKVIMTSRTFPSWKASSSKAHGQTGKDVWWPPFYERFHSSLRFFPWLHVIDALTGSLSEIIREGDEFAGRGQASVLTYLLFKELGLYDSPAQRTFTRGSYRVKPILQPWTAEVNYLGLHNEIREITPPGRLLEFNVSRHGWPEIDRFLGRPAHPPGTPFPHPRSKDGWTNDAVIDNNPLVAVGIFAILFALYLLNIAAIAGLLRLAAAPALLVGQQLLLAALQQPEDEDGWPPRRRGRTGLKAA